MNIQRIAEGLQSEVSKSTPILSEFLKAIPSDRGTWLSLRPFQAALALLDVWVHSPQFTLTEAFEITDANWRQHALDRVAGSAQKGIKGISRSFVLAPAYIDDVVFIEAGTERGRTVHKKIDGPTRLDVRAACLVMGQYGPTTAVDVNRGRIIEIGDDLSKYAPQPIPDEVLQLFFPTKFRAKQKAADVEAVVAAVDETRRARK